MRIRRLSVGKDTRQMSSDSAGPPGAGRTRALARLAVLISSKWATWLQRFGSAPLHLYLGGRLRTQSATCAYGEAVTRLAGAPGATCPRSLEKSERERKYQSFLMGVSLDCCNALNWNMLGVWWIYYVNFMVQVKLWNTIVTGENSFETWIICRENS